MRSNNIKIRCNVQSLGFRKLNKHKMECKKLEGLEEKICLLSVESKDDKSSLEALKRMKHFTKEIMLEDFEEDMTGELADTSDLPTSVIITNVENNIFLEENLKGQFEEIFHTFDRDATFQYFKSFRRVRINFTNPDAAANARIQCHQKKIGDSIVNCYFAQPLPTLVGKEGEASDTYLQPPLPVRQFLISPPASPPVGWEPADEAQPCINYDLLAAIANLTPGEAHELHPPSSTQPGVVVHVCEDLVTDGRRIKMVQTRRPMDSSSDSPPEY